MGTHSLYHSIDPGSADVKSLDGGVDKDALIPGLPPLLSASGAPFVSTTSAGHSTVLSVPRPMDAIIAGLREPRPDLLAKARQVEYILAKYGKYERDPADPKRRTHYAIAKNDSPTILPSALAPAGTPRAGLPYHFHTGLYVCDLDCISPGTPADEMLELVAAALAALNEHPPVVGYAHSASSAAWVILAGPRAEDRLAHKHYLAAILNEMPEDARLIGSMTGQNNLDRLRYEYPDPQAHYRPNWTRAELPPPTNRVSFQLPGTFPSRRSGKASESPSQRHAEMQAALEENEVAPAPLTPEDMALKRAEVQDALATIPLEDGTGHDDWIRAGYALCAADVNWPGFNGRALFVGWTRTNSYPGSTKPDMADAKYSELENDRSITLTIGPLFELARTHGGTGTTGENKREPDPTKEGIPSDGQAGASKVPMPGENPQDEAPGRPSVSSSSSEDKRQQVTLTQDEGLNIAACVHALQISNKPPTLFSTSDGGSIAMLSRGQGRTGMETCTSDDTHLEIARRVHFVKLNKKGAASAAVPTVTLMHLVHRALRRELTRFDGFKRIPFLWDGALVTSPGYHSESGYYVDLPAGLDLTLSVESALKIIDDFFSEFPFQTPADRANAYSMILGFPLKPLGIAPGLFVDKPASQTGASLLCQCLGWVIEGRTPAIVTQGRSVGELDKRMITKLKNHPGVIIFDNLTAVMDSDMAASGITDEWFGGRLLGSNKDALVPTRSLALMFTGNNLTATRDLLNRCLRCRLDANHPNPEMRTHFRHHLPGDVADNRSMLVSAVSSIVQRWIEDGMPQGAAALGRFIEYTQAAAGLMTFVGMPHFNANRRQMLTESTPSWENPGVLVLRWWEKHGRDPVKSAELVELAEELDLKGTDQRSRATSLTQRLGHVLDQVYEVEDGVHVKLIESGGRDEEGRAKRGVWYRLMEVKPGS